MKNKFIIITRHAAFRELLIERELVTTNDRVIEHATAKDVRSKHVIGTLPLHLAALAESVTDITLNLTQTDRENMQSGDITLDRLRAIAGKTRTYVVEEVR